MSESQRALLTTINTGRCTLYVVYHDLPVKLRIPNPDNIPFKKSIVMKIKKHIVTSHLSTIEDAIVKIITLVLAGPFEEANYQDMGTAVNAIIRNFCEMSEDVKLVTALMVGDPERDKLIAALKIFCASFYHFLKDLAEGIEMGAGPALDDPNSQHLVANVVFKTINKEYLKSACSELAANNKLLPNQGTDQVTDALNEDLNHEMACKQMNQDSTHDGPLDTILNACETLISSFGHDKISNVNSIWSQMKMVVRTSSDIVQTLQREAKSSDDTKWFLGLIPIPFSSSKASLNKQATIMNAARNLDTTVNKIPEAMKNYVSRPKSSAFQTALLETIGQLWSVTNVASNNYLKWKILRRIEKIENPDKIVTGNLFETAQEATVVNDKEVVVKTEIKKMHKPMATELKEIFSLIQNNRKHSGTTQQVTKQDEEERLHGKEIINSEKIIRNEDKDVELSDKLATSRNRKHPSVAAQQVPKYEAKETGDNIHSDESIRKKKTPEKLKGEYRSPSHVPRRFSVNDRRDTTENDEMDPELRNKLDARLKREQVSGVAQHVPEIDKEESRIPPQIPRKFHVNKNINHEQISVDLEKDVELRCKLNARLKKEQTSEAAQQVPATDEAERIDGEEFKERDTIIKNERNPEELKGDSLGSLQISRKLSTNENIQREEIPENGEMVPELRDQLNARLKKEQASEAAQQVPSLDEVGGIYGEKFVQRDIINKNERKPEELKGESCSLTQLPRKLSVNENINNEKITVDLEKDVELRCKFNARLKKEQTSEAAQQVSATDEVERNDGEEFKERDTIIKNERNPEELKEDSLGSLQISRKLSTNENIQREDITENGEMDPELRDKLNARLKKEEQTSEAAQQIASLDEVGGIDGEKFVERDTANKNERKPEELKEEFCRLPQVPRKLSVKENTNRGKILEDVETDLELRNKLDARLKNEQPSDTAQQVSALVEGALIGSKEVMERDIIISKQRKDEDLAGDSCSISDVPRNICDNDNKYREKIENGEKSVELRYMFVDSHLEAEQTSEVDQQVPVLEEVLGISSDEVIDRDIIGKDSKSEEFMGETRSPPLVPRMFRGNENLNRVEITENVEEDVELRNKLDVRVKKEQLFVVAQQVHELEAVGAIGGKEVMKRDTIISKQRQLEELKGESRSPPKVPRSFCGNANIHRGDITENGEMDPELRGKLDARLKREQASGVEQQVTAFDEVGGIDGKEVVDRDIIIKKERMVVQLREETRSPPPIPPKLTKKWREGEHR